jgi:hypothetical protein
MTTATSPTAENTIIQPENISVDDASTSTNDATLDSSTGKLEGAKEKSTLEMVKEALQQPKSPESEQTTTAESPTASGLDNQPVGEDGKPVATATDEEDKKLPFHNHPRWQAVIAENKSLKQAAHELESLKQATPELQDKADRFNVVADFVAKNSLEGNEVDTGFQVMAAIKQATAFGGDPNIALEVLLPIVSQLQALSGNSMPPDLQKKIDEGYIDDETAKEIAQLRANNYRTKQQATAATARVESVNTQTQQIQQQQLVQNMVSEVTKWESNWKSSDPDYARKQPLVEAKVALLQSRHGTPQNVEQALYLANFAKDEVEKELKGLVPRKEEIRTVTGGNQKGALAPKANSTQDAVMQALRGEYKMQSPSSTGN